MASTLVVNKIKGGSSGVALTLPTTDGSAGQLLKTDGSAVLGWATDAGGIASLAADTTPQLGGDLDCNGAQIQWSKGADVVSATALPVLTDGNYFDVTGTTAVTSINTTGGAGTLIKLHFDAILTLTHHATDLILPGGANITTAAGDEAEFIEYAAGDYRCTSYSKANGESVVAAAGGKVLQVVQVVKNDKFSTTNQDTSYVDITGLSVSITPSATTSKVLVQVFIGKTATNSGAGYVTNFVVLRGSTALAIGEAYSSNPRVSFTAAASDNHAPATSACFIYLDSPATTSATTYKVQMAGHIGGTHTINGQTYNNSTNDAPESRCSSMIILTEIGA